MINLEESLKKQFIQITAELGYFGFKKKEIHTEYDERFDGEWSSGWFIDGKIKLLQDVLKLYEDGYYFFLKNNSDVLNWLVTTASDVYDIDPSNVDSGLDYSKQEYGSVHYQDISIRRVLTRLKLEKVGVAYSIDNLPELKVFNGDHLVQIRGHTSEGFVLNPGQIPFHKPNFIINNYEDCKDAWWKENSVEDFYQRNKVLLVNPEKLNLRLAIIGCGDCFLEYDSTKYYQVFFRNANLLKFVKGKKARQNISGVKNSKYKFVKDSETKPYSVLRAELQI
ncbi:hypothetical protein COV11_01080 [Candidatus Woesearchaeota archaeon CG10_big_fil_rev_8_21_14_0_10_30_7]|nr:MAG: hypothetical protein COV11_01080 [Candidatus Woesearchaeota archaeon CG10_big_fil_rev_8_21_14_0_10_30_7]